MNKFASLLRKHIPISGKTARILSLVVAVCFSLAALLVLQGSVYPLNNQRGIVLQDIGALLNIPGFIALIVTTIVQSGAYDVDFFKKKSRRVKLDERQLLVRRRIYERSYNTAASIIYVVFLLVLFAGGHTTPQWIIHLNQTSFIHSYVLAAMDFGIIFFALPNIYAAWEKDS